MNSNEKTKLLIAQRVAIFAGRMGGYGLLAVAMMICIDTICRKVFQFSLVGTSELAGFVFCFTTGVAIASAALHGAHIRVDVVQRLLPWRLKFFLNLLSEISLVSAASVLAWNEGLQLNDALDFGSTSTLLDIPLWIPHLLFLAGLLFFITTSLCSLINELRHKTPEFSEGDVWADAQQVEHKSNYLQEG